MTTIDPDIWTGNPADIDSDIDAETEAGTGTPVIAGTGILTGAGIETGTATSGISIFHFPQMIPWLPTEMCTIYKSGSAAPASIACCQAAAI